MNVDSLFPEDNYENLARQRLCLVTRENWRGKLANERCPSCGVVGCFSSYVERHNSGVGLTCDACGKSHPFRGLGLQWLPKEDNAWKRGRP